VLGRFEVAVKLKTSSLDLIVLRTKIIVDFLNLVATVVKNLLRSGLHLLERLCGCKTIGICSRHYVHNRTFVPLDQSGLVFLVLLFTQGIQSVLVRRDLKVLQSDGGGLLQITNCLAYKSL